MNEYEFRIYVNSEFEEERALVQLIDGEVKILLKGDYYHDKIDDKIEGFLFGLSFSEIPYNLSKKEIHINHKDELFYMLGFNQEEFDDEDLY